MPSAKSSYWSASRSPRYSILFALPLLVLYEILAFALSGRALGDVRNGADVLLKSVFIALGGRYGVTGFSLLLAGAGAWMVIRDWRKHGGVRPRLFAGMLLESVLYAILLGFIAGALTSLLLHGRLALAAQGPGAGSFGLPIQLMISLGAGIYEELLFRVLLVSGLAALARGVLRWNPVGAGIFAAVVGAIIFSFFHYVGP